MKPNSQVATENHKYINIHVFSWISIGIIMHTNEKKRVEDFLLEIP